MHSKQRVRIRYFRTSEVNQYKKQKLRNASNHRITYVAKTTKLQSTRQSWLAFPTLRQCDRLSFSSCLERKLTAKQLNDSYNKEKTTFKTRILSLCPLVDDFDIQTRSLSRKPVQFMLAPNKRSNFDQRHYHLGSGERWGPVRLSLSFWQTTIGTNTLWGISMRPSPKCFRVWDMTSHCNFTHRNHLKTWSFHVMRYHWFDFQKENLGLQNNTRCILDNSRRPGV